MLPDDPDAQARFFYLALLGIVLAAGLVHFYRARLGTALQHAAIWGLILLGLVAAYGFSDEIASQLFPDRARPAGEQAVTLRRAGDGHFYARARVNGTEIRFLVDTGASSVVLSRADAARIGLDPESLSYTVPAHTANGTVMGAPVQLERVELGGVAASGVRAMVNAGEMRTSLLGMSYLGGFSRLSVEGDTLRLTR
ncbi:MAG TPA: TIGR02281 family clan AA aspartic protease [Thermohalobaculum sp.]|nr:TIGR02281 family clan AA aspartic protease [Thermohalobaculum sp.]